MTSIALWQHASIPPTEPCYVLVYCSDPRIDEISISWHRDGEFFGMDPYRHINKTRIPVTHWMPMPEAFNSWPPNDNDADLNAACAELKTAAENYEILAC